MRCCCCCCCDVFFSSSFLCFFMHFCLSSLICTNVSPTPRPRPRLFLSLCVLRWRPCKLSSLYCHIALLHVSVASVCVSAPACLQFFTSPCHHVPSVSPCLLLPPLVSSCLHLPTLGSSCRLLPPLATSSCLYFPACHLLSLLLPVLASSCLFLSLLVCFSLPVVALPLAFCLCRK